MSAGIGEANESAFTIEFGRGGPSTRIGDRRKIVRGIGQIRIAGDMPGSVGGSNEVSMGVIRVGNA